MAKVRFMASEFGDSDFVDSDFTPARQASTASGATSGRPPSREQLDSQVSEAQQKLAELRRAQEELERERAALEEARRRRIEYQTGREELVGFLTRGITILEESEFAARRDAEQMLKSLGDLRDALAKVESLNEEFWTAENYNAELTRALTTLDNARMEWNGARLKWTKLDGALPDGAAEGGTGPAKVPNNI
ncbi:MAG TPA: hypothetical protein VK968_12525, partial [Roseimicrobium sp.]|nr:hypothetical protein [Roseimicrobium sp.]